MKLYGVLFSSAALVGSREWATNAAMAAHSTAIPPAHRAEVLMIRWPMEKAPVSPKVSSKQLLLGSIHRIKTMDLSLRIGAKRCSKRQ